MPVVLQVPKLEKKTEFRTTKIGTLRVFNKCVAKKSSKVDLHHQTQRLTSKSSLTSLMAAINLDVPSANQRKHLGGTIMKFFPLQKGLHDTIEFKASFCWSFGLQSYESHDFSLICCIHWLSSSWSSFLDFPPSLAGLFQTAVLQHDCGLLRPLDQLSPTEKKPGKKKNEEK